jgi:hypothetical protein
MSCQIQINSISGTSPFDIYMCDTGLVQCIFIETVTSPTYPITLTTPTTLVGTTSFIIKIIDGNGCETFYPYSQPTSTQTPTLSPTQTPTLSPTQTPTPTNTLTQTKTPSNTPTLTKTSTQTITPSYSTTPTPSN